MNAPPTRGPTTKARANVAESALVAAGRYLGRTQKFITMKQPENIPAHPVPVIASDEAVTVRRGGLRVVSSAAKP